MTLSPQIMDARSPAESGNNTLPFNTFDGLFIYDFLSAVSAVILVNVDKKVE
jgi:hypothetical protein